MKKQIHVTEIRTSETGAVFLHLVDGSWLRILRHGPNTSSASRFEDEQTAVFEHSEIGGFEEREDVQHVLTPNEIPSVEGSPFAF